MSQRSALSAAASATADVSDPPRAERRHPAVGADALKARHDGDRPRRHVGEHRGRVDAVDPRRPRARSSCRSPAASRATTARAPTAACSAMARSPAVTCSPAATTTSYSARSASGDASLVKPTSRSVSPAIAETTTATSCPSATTRRTRSATPRMRSIPAIDVPPNFITMRATAVWLSLLLACAALGRVARRDRGQGDLGKEPTMTATIDPAEAGFFGALAGDWWDPAGSSAMLHRINPLRLALHPRRGHGSRPPRASAADREIRPRRRLRRRAADRAARAAGGERHRHRRGPRRISRRRRPMRRAAGWRSPIAASRSRRWRRKGEASTSSPAWRSSSTSPTGRRFSPACGR